MPMNTLPPGLAGYVLAQQQGGQKEAQQMGMLAQLMQMQGQQAQQQQQAQMAPLQMEALRLQQAELKRKQAEAAKADAFRSPENLARFVQPGRSAFTLPEGLSGPQQGAEPGKMDLQGMLQGAVQAGVLDPLAYAKEQVQERKPQFAPSRSPGYFQNGQWTPTPENVAPQRPMIEHNFSVGDNMVQPHISLDNGVTWKPVPGSKPSAKFAKQVGGTTVINPPITPVTLQDPENPNGTIIVDGRTGRKIGTGPKLTEAGKLETKRQFNMQGIGAAIAEAEKLLTDKAKPPTGSGVGAAVDFAGGLIGASPAGSVEAQKLKVAGGALTSKVPRMEGPQSEADRKLYQEMAGMVGDASIPIDRRVAALDTVKLMWEKYERLNPDTFADRRAVPGMPSQSAIDAEIARRRGR